ncbi:MAG: ABC transporter ATP-binding protein [Clostridia bacterium]|nr:ABC transporter ATP-binding protein [Clostridia bacterium]
MAEMKNGRRPMGRGPGGGMAGQKPKDFKKTFRKLLVYLKGYSIQLIIGLLFAAVSTVLAIIGPDQLQKIGKLLLGTPVNLSEITKIAIGLLIIHACSFIFSFFQSFIMSGVTAKISKDFRNKLSQKINDLPLKYLDSNSNGDILSRITNDVDLLSQTLNNSLSSIISCIATIVGSIVMMLSYSLKLTLIAVCILPISMIVISIMFKWGQKFFKIQQDSLGDINGHIEEIYSGHNVISIYNGQDDAVEKFDKINSTLYSSSVKGNIISGLMHPLMHFFGNIGYAIILIIGGMMAMEDVFFVPTIVAFVIYYKQFNNQVSQIANISSTLQTTVAASERIFEFLDEEEQENEVHKKTKLKDIKGNVEFKNVNFGYSPEKQILYDLNVKIKGGQKVAVVGSTGAGKTTLVNLLMRFYEVDSGSIEIDGVNIKDLKRENVRNLFGMVLQDTWLFEGSIKDNIAYGKKNVKDEDIIEVCKATGLHHLIKSQPKGYDMILTEDSNFSAGEKQLLTIACAMLHNAPMLILDEATSSVDTRTEVLIQKAMDKLLEGRTSFIIAHRLSTIINADIILVMKDGRIVESGKHKELLELGGVYANLYNSQF